jgi:anti-sigma B factor antagonist
MLGVNVFEEKNATVVEISGRIDSMSAHEFGDALSTPINDKHTEIVLDLAGVEYMSSAGLREIVAALKKLRRASGDLRIAQPSDRVLEVLEMAGLDTILQIYETQSDAVASF